MVTIVKIFLTYFYKDRFLDERLHLTDKIYKNKKLSLAVVKVNSIYLGARSQVSGVRKIV